MLQRRLLSAGAAAHNLPKVFVITGSNCKLLAENGLEITCRMFRTFEGYLKRLSSLERLLLGILIIGMC